MNECAQLFVGENEKMFIISVELLIYMVYADAELTRLNAVRMLLIATSFNFVSITK